uniref:Ethanolaminephosphotransferase n=1 Tax=Chlamydomonas leiostraca TaxID=1034604 RepID=A0A7S0X1J6_9CHLO|mmetsp:Transcript_9937/g.24864  ORF Transcript_9937/g.24864 Transcript_9937/m.24864 type:complete len:389 (+) Transcript_9937:140-1306(+)|eukprot:CAMPEP_0202870032 /NCGR_PEP_ID=MMETSP1391-20130828/14368_1 /ASSEMBLY_ACC=CAM_ASM_000867 /TAXON_ID=1034604 /ORGANISM="Chlamydomonas leiostraca, Strain SAG 11-49" /LENGTH=388 /DNA_ID=CAMNT_0049550457 /DNA_START=64 /DNA_END=1230 /DNA_ORIENTATION=-
MKHAYLSRRALDGLKHYKYKPGGYTILDVIHAPIWNGITDMLPMWLAPNLITLTGLMGVIGSYLISAYYLPDFVGQDTPRWVFALNALATVVYVNLDCIDGKQARRTRSSSPLGQLFDHGCDALSVHLLLGNTQVAIGAACGPLTGFMQFVLMVTWILAHWEEYHTGNLLYGNGLCGVLEANYALATMSAVSAAFGVGVWDTPLSTLLPFLPACVTQPYVLRHGFYVVAILGCVPLISGQLWRVLTSDPKALPKEEVGHKELGRDAQVRQLALLGGLMLLGLWWQSDPGAGAAVGQCRVASHTYGVMYALVASQLIMTHMAKEPFRPAHWAYWVVAAGTLNAYTRALPVLPFSAALAAGAGATYLHYVWCVVEQVCVHLGIKCLTIKH